MKKAHRDQIISALGGGFLGGAGLFIILSLMQNENAWMYLVIFPFLFAISYLFFYRIGFAEKIRKLFKKLKPHK